MSALLDSLTQSTRNARVERTDYASGVSESVMTMLIIFGAIIFLVTLFVAIFMSSIISKPIKNLVKVAHNVASGNVNINVNRSHITKDEIGELTGDVYAIVGIINNIIEDLSKLSYEFIDVGDIDYRIDANKYSNAFKEVMQKTNGIMQAEVDSMLPMLTAMNKLANGDFEINVPDLPGKKMIMPQSVRDIVSKLNKLHVSIFDLTEKSAMGDFSSRIDVSLFNGNWAVLSGKLNDLMDAVALPLADVKQNIILMSEGDFSPLTGEYHGIFKTLQNTCNLVNTAVETYIEEISETLYSIQFENQNFSCKQKYFSKYGLQLASLLLYYSTSLLNPVEACVYKKYIVM
jgi:HAMP domain-containing protein